MLNSDKTIFYRLIPASLLFGAWFALVLLRMTEVGPFIGAVQMVLIGLGVYHTTKPRPEDKP